MPSHDIASPLRLAHASTEIDLTEDEWIALATAYTQFGKQGDAVGRIRLLGGAFEGSSLDELDAFIAAVRAQFGAPLRVYDHGGGVGTIRKGDHAFLDLVERLGLRYEKTVARHAHGSLERYEAVVFRRGRKASAKGGPPAPETIGDVAPLVTVLEKLAGASHGARAAGVPLRATPRRTYEDL